MAADRCWRFPPRWVPSLFENSGRGRAMKTSLGIVLAAAASLVSSTAFAQVLTPRGRTAQGYVVEKASGGYLGIGGLDISPERAKALNLQEERGGGGLRLTRGRPGPPTR